MLGLELLCPQFVIPKDHQGAESDAKAKSLYSPSSSSIPYLHRHSGEILGRRASFKRTKVLLGPGAVGEVMAVASADWLGKGWSPVVQVAGRVLIGKFELVSGRLLKGRSRWRT